MRLMRKLVDEIFRAMGQEFDRLYAKKGRPSIPLERHRDRTYPLLSVSKRKVRTKNMKHFQKELPPKRKPPAATFSIFILQRG